MEVAELLNCSLDFIEQPYTELELYTKEIDFNTSKSKGHQLLSKVKNYISILKNDAVINKFKLAEIVTDYIGNEEFHSFSDDPNYSREKLIRTCEELYPILKNSLSGEFFYWWASAYFGSKYIDKLDQIDQIESYNKAINIYKLGVEQDPSFGGNYHFLGYCQLELSKLINEKNPKKLLLKEAINNFRNSWETIEHIMYSVECFIELNDYKSLINFLNESITLEVVKNNKNYVFQTEYIPSLLKSLEFCDWYTATFEEDPNLLKNKR